MSIKSLVVFVDDTLGGAPRIDYAIRLARRHEAYLIGIFALPTLGLDNPSASFVRGDAAIRNQIQRHKAEEDEAAERARVRFVSAVENTSVGSEFRLIRQGSGDREAEFNSLHADLVIVGNPRPGGLPREWAADALLLATGVPFLIVPEEWQGRSVAEHILLGWNASREARRSLTDARALLTAAQSVTIVVVDPHKNTRHGQEPGADIAHYLSRHGAKVTVKHMLSQGEAIADVLRDYAEHNNIDLIVLGAYSHARSQEVIFGGVTRSLMSSTPVPLLIAH